MQNIWQPATDAQRLALDCPADLLFFGGSAGSLKSHWLLLDAMQEWEHPRLRALITRDTFPNLRDLIDKSFRIYQPKGGVYNEQKKTWTFPAGGQIRFGYMASDRDVYGHWGHEYSFEGHDESTFQTEFRIRTLLSRLRATDPTLKLRARLASNPGNIGASWHQEIFLRGACPVHNPDVCAVPGKVYKDRVWPSDGVAIPFSVAFIPGKLTDHNLLGEQYAQTLKSMSGALADQLLSGCWCKLEGAYFAFLGKDYIRKYAEVEQEPWYAHFISLDYGYGKSSAAAGLYVRGMPEPDFPKGRIRKLGELCVPNMPVEDFAKLVAERFVLPEVKGQRRSIVAAYADPANFNENHDRRIGKEGYTIAEQIQEVLEPYGIELARASNDRIGGWQHAYRMLRSREFEICDTCPKTFEAFRTRMHDEKPGDVMKVKGDALDDVADETRYALYTFVDAPEMPRQIRQQERIKPLLDARDFTSLAIQQSNFQSEEKESAQPASLGRRRRRLF